MFGLEHLHPKSFETGTSILRKRRIEATAIARLYGNDPTKVVGWLYVWNTNELGIKWKSCVRTLHFIDPPVELDQYPRKLNTNARVLMRVAQVQPIPSPQPVSQKRAG